MTRAARLRPRADRPAPVGRAHAGRPFAGVSTATTCIATGSPAERSGKKPTVRSAAAPRRRASGATLRWSARSRRRGLSFDGKSRHSSTPGSPIRPRGIPSREHYPGHVGMDAAGVRHEFGEEGAQPRAPAGVLAERRKGELHAHGRHSRLPGGFAKRNSPARRAYCHPPPSPSRWSWRVRSDLTQRPPPRAGDPADRRRLGRREGLLGPVHARAGAPRAPLPRDRGIRILGHPLQRRDRPELRGLRPGRRDAACDGPRLRERRHGVDEARVLDGRGRHGAPGLPDAGRRPAGGPPRALAGHPAHP